MIYRFYEIRTQSGFEYYRICTRNKKYFAPLPLRLSYESTRVWEWDTETDQVFYKKNRSGPSASVDLKEFMLIKLAAQEYVK